MPNFEPSKCIVCDKILGPTLPDGCCLVCDSSGFPAVCCEQCFPIYRRDINPIISSNDMDNLLKEIEEFAKQKL